MRRRRIKRRILGWIDYSYEHDLATIGVLLIIVGILWTINYQIKYKYSTEGINLGKIEDETNNIKNQNLELKEQIYRFSSLHVIEVEARKMGFIDNKNNYLYIEQ